MPDMDITLDFNEIYSKGNTNNVMKDSSEKKINSVFSAGLMDKI